MRRGHGSTKVPGVKLRPALPTKSGKSNEVSDPTCAQSSNTNVVDSTEILRSCRKPFLGIVVCGSGLSDKINLFQQAVQLGAQTSSDLTDRVTHLICEDPGSAKYKYCVEHGVPILQPSWITEAYRKWISGECVNVIKSADAHRFPTFKTVKLCITGINDVGRRKEIREQLEKNGGNFVETLGKDVAVTHLLCGPDRGGIADQQGMTSKMHFVVKSNKSRTEKAHLVWEDWFWDCLESKGILNEQEYLATGPRPPRRIRREPSPLLAPIASTAEQRKDMLTPSAISPLENCGDIGEAASIKRVPEAATMLWENVLRKRGFEVRNGKLARSLNKNPESRGTSADVVELSPSSMRDRLRETATDMKEPSTRTKSSLDAAFERAKSFSARTVDVEVAKTVFQRVKSTAAADLKVAASLPGIGSGVAGDDGSSKVPEGERSLFVGLKFRALGEASGPKLTEALELRGGTVVADGGEPSDFIIVRLVGGNVFYHDEPRESERAKFRTECWIEQCIFEERICGAEEHPAFVPLNIPLPISGANKLVLHVSGLTPAEKTLSVRLIKAIGSTITDQLSRKNTHLICPCGTGPKFTKAQEWKIPVLELEWLFAIAKTGVIQDLNKYLVSSAAPVASSTSALEDKTMTDITNSEFIQGSLKCTTSGKSFDKSESSTSSSVLAAVASHAEAQSGSSDSWGRNDHFLESVAEHPPNSSSPVSHLPDDEPTTPSPIRRQATTKAAACALFPFTSPTKPKQPAIHVERVPSSATPSPMKMPSKNTLRNEHEGPTVSMKPATTTASTLSSESAQNLKEAIASLLGKRHSSDDADAESQNNVQPAQQIGRPACASKRSKPPPRTRSRQDSGDPGRAFSRTTSLEVLGRTGSGLSAYSFDFQIATVDGVESPIELGGLASIGTDAAEESMRVTYEDPSQRAEEQRLKCLLSGEAVDMDPPQDASKNEERLNTDETSGEKPRPRRRGRNLVRRVTSTAGQS